MTNTRLYMMVAMLALAPGFAFAKDVNPNATPGNDTIPQAQQTGQPPSLVVAPPLTDPQHPAPGDGYRMQEHPDQMQPPAQQPATTQSGESPDHYRNK